MYRKYFHCNLCRRLYLISAYILFHTLYKYWRVYDTPAPVLGLLGQVFFKRLWSGREGGERCTCWWMASCNYSSPWGDAIGGVEGGGARSLQAAVLASTLCPTACPSLVIPGSWEEPGTQAGRRLHTHMTRVRAEPATRFSLERWQALSAGRKCHIVPSRERKKRHFTLG